MTATPTNRKGESARMAMPPPSVLTTRRHPVNASPSSPELRNALNLLAATVKKGSNHDFFSQWSASDAWYCYGILTCIQHAFRPAMLQLDSVAKTPQGKPMSHIVRRTLFAIATPNHGNAPWMTDERESPWCWRCHKDLDPASEKCGICGWILCDTCPRDTPEQRPCGCGYVVKLTEQLSEAAR
jgi:hypothetical protein